MKKVFLSALAFTFCLPLFAQQEIKENVYFDYDKYNLTADAKLLIEHVSNQIKEKENIEIKLMGYTDAAGAETYNLNLSKNRCNTVFSYFITQGFTKNQISTMCYGESKPAAANMLDKDKQLNRRVEILITVKSTNAAPTVVKEAVVFLINTTRDTTLICKEGTKIKIDANSFEAETTDQKVPKNITISVQEYYKISDILLANLNTNSNNQMLETGGMVNITATNDNQNFKLKMGEEIEIGFPAKEIKKDMEVFNGEWIDPRQINWTNQTAFQTAFIGAHNMPEFIGGEAALHAYLKKSIVYPEREKELGIQGTVIVSLVIGKKGEVKNLRVVRGVSKEIDKEALRVIKNMPNWQPGGYEGQIKNVQLTLPIKFTLTGGTINYTIGSKNRSVGYSDTLSVRLYPYAENTQEEINEVIPVELDINEALQNVIYSNRIGWINCDRFVKQEPKITYKLTTYDMMSNVKLIFDNYKAVFQGTRVGSSFRFENVPLNEKITIVATKIINDKNYLAIKETTITNELESNLEFKEVTLENYILELQKLDKFKR